MQQINKKNLIWLRSVTQSTIRCIWVFSYDQELLLNGSQKSLNGQIGKWCRRSSIRAAMNLPAGTGSGLCCFLRTISSIRNTLTHILTPFVWFRAKYRGKRTQREIDNGENLKRRFFRILFQNCPSYYNLTDYKINYPHLTDSLL